MMHTLPYTNPLWVILPLFRKTQDCNKHLPERYRHTYRNTKHTNTDWRLWQTLELNFQMLQSMIASILARTMNTNQWIRILKMQWHKPKPKWPGRLLKLTNNRHSNKQPQAATHSHEQPPNSHPKAETRNSHQQPPATTREPETATNSHPKAETRNSYKQPPATTGLMGGPHTPITISLLDRIQAITLERLHWQS